MPRGGREAARLLASAARARRKWAGELLAGLVGTESHASQLDGVNAVGARVVSCLAEAGFAAARRGLRVEEEMPDWLKVVMLPDGGSYAVADCWLADRPGHGAPILLLGDLDTAFPPGTTARFGYRRCGELAYGPGIADMKGGLVVLALAARLLAETGLAAPPMRVVLSPDEQAGSLASRRVVREQSAGCAFCLTFECARDGGHLMDSRAAVGLAQVRVQGLEAHAGTSRDKGRSAVAGFARLVGPIEGLSATGCGRLVTITLLQAGWRRSVVPGECSFVIDLRAKNQACWDRTQAELTRLIHGLCAEAGLTATVQLSQHRPAVAPDRSAEPLKALAQYAGRLLGLEFGFRSSWAAGSSAFANTVPVLDGMGPPGGDLMTESEHIELGGLNERAALSALILHMAAAGLVGRPGDPEKGTQ